MTYRQILFTRPFLRLVIGWLIVTALVFGVCAECQGEGGTYQGGSDSVPYHRS